ncbi:rhomboid family protein [Loa loa]|uniref:Rhomboid family protein n=1 Tax=Loa loa TaxID=7209 RepID=A0A1I7VSE7_LOALO|nr:rhomboid family protein [Loa loa]EFO22618.2 rhomboid family protein [Loa loa]
MSGGPDRSRLTLPLKNITTRDDVGIPESANIGLRLTQQKLMKSLSTPADYFVPTPMDLQFPPSCSNSLKESGSYPPLSREHSIRDTISNGTAKFFGVPPSECCHSSVSMSVDQKWSYRRLRFICRHYGNPKEDTLVRGLRPQNLDDQSDVPSPSKSVTSQSEIRETVFMASEIGRAGTFSRSRSVESRGSRLTQQQLERRDSVMKMVCDGISSMIQRGTLRPKMACATVKRGRSVSSSFAPFSIQQTVNTASSRIGPPAVDTSAGKGMTTVVKVGLETPKVMGTMSELKKLDGKETDVSSLKKNRSAIHFSSEVEAAAQFTLPREVIGQKKPLLPSELTKYDGSVVPVVRSQAQVQTVIDHETVEKKGPGPFSSIESIQDEVFFDYALPTVSPNISDTEQGTHHCQGLRSGKFSPVTKYKKFCSEDDPVEDDIGNLCDDGSPVQKMQPQGSEKEKSTAFASLRNALSSPKEWLQDVQDVDERTTKRTAETCRSVRKRLLLDTIHSELKSRKYSVPHRRRFGNGFGIWRKYFQRTYRKDIYQLNEDAYIDCRPFFTYWITTVQILVTVISLYTYGVGPWGFGLTERTADVLHTTVTLKRVSIYMQQNIWFGPKFADLVHLGAKFAPCMREDPKIFEQIEADHKEENETGCCIYNDGTGCFQTGRSTCPSLIATLARWKKDNPGPEGRVSGAVCGQDPRYCEDPVSVKPYEWPDDMTHWPVCKQVTLFVPENVMHMQCEITGRPCCIQLHGQCRITTRDYCDFVEGYFHENATLCSQVSCLSEICGMLPFLRKNQPDQWYRLFIPLFLHAGIIHCILTVFIQMLYMRDLEKLLGWARVALLYMVPGIGGYLAGAIFVPYKPEVGPAGSHVGMFAAMYVDVVYSWNLLERPWHAIMQLSLFTVAVFAVGTLPWVDNWAHFFGFIFGILVSLAVLPYIQTKHHNRARRLIIVITSLSIVFGLFVVLLTMFYWPSAFNCTYCEYFNCIPYTDHFCDNQGLRLKSWLPI